MHTKTQEFRKDVSEICTLLLLFFLPYGYFLCLLLVIWLLWQNNSVFAYRGAFLKEVFFSAEGGAMFFP